MRRLALATAALAAILAGCPLPQPLPDYPAGTITPPRILVDELLGNGAVIFVPAGCQTTEPTLTLSARVSDTNTIESIGTRWFVNYDYRDDLHSQAWRPLSVPPNPDTTNLTRNVPPWTFGLYSKPPPYETTPPLPGPPWDQAGVLRVVELVVSNGFDPAMDGTIAAGANRTPLPSFETQYHRWVFLTVPESASVPCPP